MTATRRIVINTAATYGRSLFALLCGLFSGRWTLMALGEVDYGLFGVVGGLTGFIAFFNGVLAFSIARFYATAVGRTQAGAANGLEECRKWFSIAVCIHTIVPVILMIVGYPLGLWAVRHWLEIPFERVETCVWMFRFVCVSCFFGMVAVPFQAMYTAKQYIAELTVYSIITTVLNVVVLYYMVCNPGSWLGKYALWTCVLTLVPQIVIAIRSVIIFPECRFRFKSLRVRESFRELFAYTGWQMFGSFGSLMRSQGMQILVNKYYGPAVNSAMSIANTVNTHTQSLACSMVGAIQPAISNAFGAGDLERMKTLSFCACKFGMLAMLIFAIPLSVELPEVMRIWLKNPPEYAVELCWCIMVISFINMSAIGHDMAVNASGKIAGYQVVIGGTVILTLPLAWVFCAMGLGPVWIGCAGIIMMALTLVRVLFARRLLGLSVMYWVVKVLAPVLLVSFVSAMFGWCYRVFMESSFWRVVAASMTTEVVFCITTWIVVLDIREREFIKEKFICKFRK